MWYTLSIDLPYSGDPDYRDTVIAAVKKATNGAPVDITKFDGTYSSLEVYTTKELAERLTDLNLIREVRHSIDREMLCGPRTVV